MSEQKHTPYYYVDTQFGDRYCLMDGNDMSKKGAYRMLDEIKKVAELTKENEQLTVDHYHASGNLEIATKELSRIREELKEAQENYEGMKGYCKYLTEINVFNMAFDKADEHWRKSHKVEEGEDFISWYMKHHAAEREADRKDISRLREREKELVEALRELYKQQPTMLTLIPDAALDFLDLPKKATLLKVESLLSKFEAPNV